MTRAHLYRPVTNNNGDLLYGAQVTVRKADLGGSITQTLWSGQSSQSPAVNNPFTVDRGFVDIWLDDPERVNLLISAEGMPDVSVYLDVQAPADEIVRSVESLTVTNIATEGQVLKGLGPGQAEWGDPPAPPDGAVPVHYHDGTGSHSTALGQGSTALADQSVAIGDLSSALGPRASALGYQASAVQDSATALGNGAIAAGVRSSALGYLSQAAADEATAVGHSALASASRATALGSSAQATGSTSLAVGYLATASGTNSVAVGNGANAGATSSLALGDGALVSPSHSNSVALGVGAQTTNANQIMLGTASHTVSVIGSLTSAGDAVLAGSGFNLGFFGVGGVTRQPVTGSDGGNLSLRALLVYLDSLGLIFNQSTQG